MRRDPLGTKTAEGDGRTSRRVRVALGAVLAAATITLLCVASGGAATPATPYDVVPFENPDPVAFSPVAGGEGFAGRIIDVGDLTGDGVRDLFFATRLHDISGFTDAGIVYLVNGRTREVIYKRLSPDPQTSAQFGFYIQSPGDVNGDGKDDIAVGASGQNVGGNVNQGRVYVFDGPTGALLYAIDNPHPQAEGSFGGRIGAAGDVTGDGRPDLVVGATTNDLPAGCGNSAPLPPGCKKNVGQAFLFDGTNGALVREFNTPPADVPAGCTGCGNLGGSVEGLGDVNGDNVPDQYVAAYTLVPGPNQHGRIYVFSGADGTVLSRIDQPVPDANAFWGLVEQAPNTPGDVNGDGVADIYGAGFTQDGANGEASAGRAWVFDGRASVLAGHGVVLYELKDPTPQASEAFGFNVSRTDYNRDGVPDLYLASLQGLNTETYVYDGRDGSLLKTLSMPAADVQPNAPGNGGSALGFSARAPGDLNGDGEPDFVASAVGQDVGGIQDVGRVYFFLSRVPATPPPPPPPPATPPPPPPPPPPPATTPVAAFAGCPSTTIHVIKGSAKSNTLIGTAAGDRIFALAGNDVVKGLAGNDCINLGAGNDRAAGGAGSDRILGGAGNDRITGDAGNDKITGGSGRDTINGGAGNDTVSARDRARDRITCGAGRDSVTADRIDSVSRNCERVRRS